MNFPGSFAIAGAAIVGTWAAARAVGEIGWRARGHRLRGELLAMRRAAEPAPYDSREIEGLPAPVRNYFRAVLTDGQPRISGIRIEHLGLFNRSETAESWVRFHSRQLTTTRPPGFLWDARIRMAPGLTACVHDAYVGGEGLLLARLLGLVTVARAAGGRELAEGELMRYLAEAVWYPTALLHSEALSWEGFGERAARATLRDGEIAVSLDFEFDREWLVAAVSAPARHRQVAGTSVPMPWRGRFWEWDVRSGMRIPLSAEVGWELPSGRLPYWQGRITAIEYLGTGS